jgi:hypothetical protein
MGEVWNFVPNFEMVMNTAGPEDHPLFMKYPESLKELAKTNDFSN